MRAPLLAAAFVLCAATQYEPTVLTVTFVGGRQIQIAAVSTEVCETAREALSNRLWRLDDEPAIASSSCAPGDLFSERSRCIAGFNCPAGLR